ncbi:large polymerase protein [avian paramyxovirus 12]|uniref:RNA-directed RNA polymerase L n=1 Tax=avian paramyxovirus 12 TaxID=2560320 RepID=M4QTX8_9MONO|nr:large polymerase protein [Avian orthoavulavirus 12]AGH32603.1 large polymerase protein [Avian orthoavulavirus 12]
MGSQGASSNAHNLILPESHLSSPIVKHKLLYYWRLTGLPLPSDDQYDSLIITRDWKTILNSNKGEVSRMINLGRQTHSYLNHKLPVLSVTHPSTLKWLTSIRSTISDEKFATIEKFVRSHIRAYGARFSDLSNLVERKLYGESYLPGRSQEFKNLLSNPGVWFHNQWTHSRNLWLHVKQLQRHLIVKCRERKNDQSIFTIEAIDGVVLITAELVSVVDNRENRLTCLTQEMVLMYADLLEGRSMITLHCSLLPYLTPLGDKINDLLSLVDELSLTIKGDIYEIVAILEAMAYSVVQLFEPNELFAGDFFSFNLSEIKTLLLLHFSTPIADSIIRAISVIYSGISCDQGAEMLCVLRLWGHPLLTASTAAKAVRTQMCAPKIIDYDITMQVLSFFKGTIINGYRKKNSGIWPKVNPSSIHSEIIHQLYLDSAEISHAIMLREYKALSLLEFAPCIDFDPISDLSMFLKDKAIARPSREWLSSFKTNLLTSADRPKKNSSQASNRLLLEFLESSEFDPYKEMEYLNSLAYLDDDDVSVSYSLKEKEVKINGRIFAKLTKSLRNCQVMAESILAAEIAPFFQGNGVIQDSISLSKSMLAMSQMSFNCNKDRLLNTKRRISSIRESSNNQKEKIRLATFLTTDLSKYCLNWRYQTIKPFARAINQLMGLEHFFEWIHLRLMNTTMYVGDPYNPPQEVVTGDINDQPNDDIFIVSARGGIEGLCQKLWSMISISAINLAATRADCRVACMVQGDNQVIASTKEIHCSDDPEQALRQLHELSDRFFRELIIVNHGLGHNLKLRETMRSNTFFVYSKRVFKDGRILSQLLKNAAKITLISGDLGEDTVASASDISGTIARICENGAGKDFSYLFNYYMLCVQFYFDQEFSIINRAGHDIRKTSLGNIELVHNYLLTPSQVGGVNGLQYVRLYNRNIGDPGTTAFAEMKRLVSAQLLSRSVIENVMTRPPGSGNWATLCSDPYSFNFDGTRSPSIVLKKHTQKVLFESCSNPLLAGVHQEDMDSEENDLARFLLDQEYIHPRVAHVIMQASSIGRRKQIQGLLDTTSTIIKYALDKRPLSIKKSERIQNYPALHFQLYEEDVWSPTRRNSPLISSDMCSVSLADYCRNRSWSVLTGGRPILGVSNPDSLELISGCIVSVSGSCRLCDSGDSQYTWFHLPGNIDLSDDAVGNPAIRVPYLGSKTQERRVASMAKIRAMSPHTKAALRASSVLIWAFGDNEINWEAALAIANSRCAIDLDHLKVLAPLPTAGNLQHRLDDGISQVAFTPASLYRVSSYVQISNDSQRLITEEGVRESNLIYQQIMLLGLASLEALFPLGTKYVTESLTLHLHSAHSCCLREASVSFPIALKGDPPSLRKEVQNRFMYDPNPISLIEIPKLDITVFRSYELNLDSYSTIDLMEVLALSTGKLVGQSIISYDEETSIKNDAIVVHDNSRNWISEFQNCDTVKLLEYAALEILLDCSYQMYYLRVIGFENIMLYLSDTIRAMPGILLSNLAATVSHPSIFGRLYRSGMVSTQGSHQLASIDFISLSSQVLMKAIRRMLTSFIQGDKPILLFPSVLDDTINDKFLQLIARYCCLVTLLFAKNDKVPKIRNMSPEDKCRELTQYLVSPSTSRNYPHVDMNDLLTPKIDTFPANLYYMARKSLNLIREREDRDTILALIFPIPYHEELSHEKDPLTEVKDPFYTGECAFLIELRQGTDASRDLTKDELETVLPVSRLSNQATADLRKYLFRGIGQASSSWYKIGQLFSIPEVRQSRGTNALYLGEGSGALMSLTELYLPHRMIYYHTQFDNAMNPPQRHFGPSPSQFLDSVVYQNMQADIPCALGFIQEFKVLWREVAAETDLTRGESVTYITTCIPCQGIGFLMVDAELPSDSPVSVIEEFITNIMTIGLFCMADKGVMIIKALFTRTLEFNFMVNCMMLAADRVILISNGHMCRGDGECYIIGWFRSCVSAIHAGRVIQGAKQKARSGVCLLDPYQTQELVKLFVDQQAKVDEIITAPLENLTKYLTHNIDTALLAAGGRPTRPHGCDNAIISPADDIAFKEIIVKHIDTALKSIIYFFDEGCLADTVFLLTPYNLSNRGKVSTLVHQTVRQLFEQELMRVRKEDLFTIDRMITLVMLGRITLNDIIHWKEYLRRSSCKKYVRQRLGSEKVKTIFCYDSEVVLNRSTQKIYMKVIGNAVKGYYGQD